jgi:hypothetical protein
VALETHIASIFQNVDGAKNESMISILINPQEKRYLDLQQMPIAWPKSWQMAVHYQYRREM